MPISREVGEAYLGLKIRHLGFMLVLDLRDLIVSVSVSCTSVESGFVICIA